MIDRALDFTVIIPSRYASTRLPGKPLLAIGDKTLIVHVCECAAKSAAVQVVVATDDARIADHVKRSGYGAVMTSESCESGTDRIAQAVNLLDLDDAHIIVNLQGDEPFMPAGVIKKVVQSLVDNPIASLSTACELITKKEDFLSHDVVKVVRDCNDFALYFSRSHIPYCHESKQNITAYKHLGIYAYRVGYIKKFASKNPCELEAIEKLEQLRALWQGDKIIVAQVTQPTGIGVDTPADLEKARSIYASMHR